MKRLLLGTAAGLTALTVGAGIAAAQSDDGTVVDDTVVDDTVVDDSTDAPADDDPSTATEPGCEGDGDRAGGRSGEAPAPTGDTSTSS
jgi:hypothetical protein